MLEFLVFVLCHMSSRAFVYPNKTSHTAWCDTIYTGMTHRNHTMRFAYFRGAEHRATLEAVFVRIWCVGEGFFFTIISLRNMEVVPLPPTMRILSLEKADELVAFSFRVYDLL